MRDYTQPFGLDGLPIATHGSLLVASCIILERFGSATDPVTLDAYLKQFGGVEELDVTIPCRYDGGIAISVANERGMPTTSNAIVQFTRTTEPGDSIEHYCAVHRIEGNAVVIIDSLDGQVKFPAEYEPLYGTPIRWWSYSSVVAVPGVEPEKPTTYRVNTVNNIVYTAFDKPTKYYVKRVTGTDRRDFSHANTWRDFINVEHKHYGEPLVLIGEAYHPVPPAGATFYITPDDWGQFSRTGEVKYAAGYPAGDLSTSKPPKLLTPVPATEVAKPKPVLSDVVVKPKQSEYQTTYKQLNASGTPDTYVVLHKTVVRDFTGKYDAITVGPEEPIKTLKLYGIFWVDGICYGRAKPPGDTNFVTWYGVEMTDPETNAPIVVDELDLIDPATNYQEKTVLKTVKFRDHLQHAGSKVEHFADSLYNRLKRSNKKR